MEPGTGKNQLITVAIRAPCEPRASASGPRHRDAQRGGASWYQGPLADARGSQGEALGVIFCTFPEVLASWRERLHVLQAQLQNDEADGCAWQWRIEAKVLRFLLRRYGNRVPPYSPEPAPAPHLSLQLSLIRLSLAACGIKTKHERPSPEQCKTTLQRIGRVNQEARLQAERERRSALTPVVDFEAAAHRDRVRRQADARLRQRGREFMLQARRREAERRARAKRG